VGQVWPSPDVPGTGAQGGGGGGAGRIRLNTYDSALSIATGAVLSPSQTADACNGLCSPGDLNLW